MQSARGAASRVCAALLMCAGLSLAGCEIGTGPVPQRHRERPHAGAPGPAPATAAGCACEALPPPTGAVIPVGTVSELVDATDQANASGHVTILIEDGTYTLGRQLAVTADDVAFRSRSGRRDAVTLRGGGMAGGVPHVFEVSGDGFVAADLTLGWVANHGIQVHGEDDADAPRIHNVRFVDTFEQMLKVSFREGDATSSNGGIVECSLFEYSARIGPQWYIGGVDAHQAHDWIVRDNVFRYIRSPEAALAEHAVHFWTGSSGTLVERNVVVDCDRGLGFGLGSRGHTGGTIRNNMVYTTRDVGIGLESSPGTVVANNSVYVENYDQAIEYRFAATTGVSIVNNLANAAIASRDGGSATLAANVTNAAASWFAEARAGDLHLAGWIDEVVDRGQSVPGVIIDIDCQPRPRGAAPDIGADEFQPVTSSVPLARAGYDTSIAKTSSPPRPNTLPSKDGALPKPLRILEPVDAGVNTKPSLSAPDRAATERRPRRRGGITRVLESGGRPLPVEHGLGPGAGPDAAAPSVRSQVDFPPARRRLTTEIPADAAPWR